MHTLRESETSASSSATNKDKSTRSRDPPRRPKSHVAENHNAGQNFSTRPRSGPSIGTGDAEEPVHPPASDASETNASVIKDLKERKTPKAPGRQSMPQSAAKSPLQSFFVPSDTPIPVRTGWVEADAGETSPSGSEASSTGSSGIFDKSQSPTAQMPTILKMFEPKIQPMKSKPAVSAAPRSEPARPLTNGGVRFLLRSLCKDCGWSLEVVRTKLCPDAEPFEETVPHLLKTAGAACSDAQYCELKAKETEKQAKLASENFKSAFKEFETYSDLLRNLPREADGWPINAELISAKNNAPWTNLKLLRKTKIQRQIEKQKSADARQTAMDKLHRLAEDIAVRGDAIIAGLPRSKEWLHAVIRSMSEGETEDCVDLFSAPCDEEYVVREVLKYYRGKPSPSENLESRFHEAFPSSNNLLRDWKRGAEVEVAKFKALEDIEIVYLDGEEDDEVDIWVETRELMGVQPILAEGPHATKNGSNVRCLRLNMQTKMVFEFEERDDEVSMFFVGLLVEIDGARFVDFDAYDPNDVSRTLMSDEELLKMLERKGGVDVSATSGAAGRSGHSSAASGSAQSAPSGINDIITHCNCVVQ